MALTGTPRSNVTLRTVYSLADENHMRAARVNVTDGYTTVLDVPRILAVKHYSTNNAAAVAKVSVHHTCADTHDGGATCVRCLMLAAGARPAGSAGQA
jgi:hypothetical protein